MVTIRPARLEDCQTCHELGKIQELAFTNGSFLPEEFFRIRVDHDQMFFVAEEEGQVIGFVVGEPLKGGIAYMGSFTVAEAWRGKGIGKMLISALVERCKEKKMNTLFFCAPKFNEKTIGFYRSQGFVQGYDQALFMKQF